MNSFLLKCNSGLERNGSPQDLWNGVVYFLRMSTEKKKNLKFLEIQLNQKLTFVMILRCELLMMIIMI